MLLTNLESSLWSGTLVPVASLAEVAAWVEELSDLYTVERSMLARKQGDRAHLGAKVLYFLCADAPKVGLALEECVRRDARFAAPRRIVDLGCGVGATSVGALDWLARRGSRDPIAIELVDREAPALRLAESIVRRAAELAGIPATLSTRIADLREVSVQDVDLVLCQTALNEHLARTGTESEYDESILRAVHGWTRSARTLLIEPALKSTTRALQRLRDSVLAEGGARVVAPCPHQRPCPLLARPGDWCHETRRFDPTPMVAAVQARTRRRDDLLTYAFQAFAPGPIPENGHGTMPWRLLTAPLGSKGKTERLVCRGDGQIRTVRVLDKERSEANRLLVEARQGSLVALDPEPISDRIGSDVRVVPAP